MNYISRLTEPHIRHAIKRGKSILLLGPRQTGKTTLLERLQSDLFISLVRPDVRQRYEKEPSLLCGEVEALKSRRRPLVLLDEVQKVPEILDAVQDLIDRKIATFVLTGSSARKLRRGSSTNLLPGRIISLRLDPLTYKESEKNTLKERLLYGSLPGIIHGKAKNEIEQDLQSYVTTYLEEEVRSEAIVRNLGAFARFLEYAAAESGSIVNFRKLSQEIGVAHTTIRSYYQILEDCLVVERVEPITKSKTRKKLTKTQKYLFFDMGVRRVAAREGVHPPKEVWGTMFEQYVGLELLRYARLSPDNLRIMFWRDPDGPEVDWVIENNHHYTPIEVKWTDAPSLKDAQHLKVFLREHKNCGKGYVVCRTPRRIKLDTNIFAIPWQEISGLL